MTSPAAWAADFKSHAGRLPGANVPWLAARRGRAMERFAAEGWPSTKLEDWRHTSLVFLAQQEFMAAPVKPVAASSAALAQQLRQGEAGHWLFFIDGRYAPELSDVGTLPGGVQIASVGALLQNRPESLEPYFGDELSGASTVALNLAWSVDGAFVYVARGTELETPVHLVFIAEAAQSASFPRNIVVLEEGAQATLVEHYVGHDSRATLTNTVTRTVLGADARLNHLKLQQEGDEAFHLGQSVVEQARSSSYDSHSMSFGARLARHDIATQFNGEHCETLLNGLYYVDGRRHVDHHTRIGHARPQGKSREFYRGILADTAHGVFTGRILVSPGADGTDAVQRSDSLLLSRLAKADARPELEIYADDVKCAHGATVGQIDDDSLFYLRARGLDPVHARNVLTYAFAAQALERIAPALLRQRVASAIRSLLPGGNALGDSL